MQNKLRAGRAARLQRYEIAELSGLTTDAIDRLALAIGVRSLASRGAGPEDDDDRGDMHAVSPLVELGAEGLVTGLLTAIGADRAGNAGYTDAALGIRRALNRGYSELQAAMGRPNATWHGVLGGLMAEVHGPQGDETATSRVAAIELELGRMASGDKQPVTWRVNHEGGHANNANTRIAGASGKGKTQVLLHAIQQVATRSPTTGAFIFDYKGDIASDTAFVSSIGARVVEPAKRGAMPINPFELPGELPPTIAARAFAELFASIAPGIGAVQRHLLNESMRSCFDRAKADGKSGPTLTDIHRAVLRRYEQEGRTEDTVTATLADIAGLGLFVDHTMDIEQLLSTRWIIKLDSLGQLRQVVAFVVIEYLHNLANALADAPFDGERKLRHLRSVIAIDEAHYYLRGRCDGLLGLVRIGRSKGTPVFPSSQSLEDYRGYTELDELFANTLVFGHGKPPSAKTIAGALALGRDAASRAADRVTRLPQFHALTNIAGKRSADAVRCDPFFERHGA